MEFYTMTRRFIKQDVIDKFHSAIWAERYYGDNDFEIVVPASIDLIQKLPLGTFIGLNGSIEPGIIETRDFEDGKMKVTGISLMKWMNNRFLRASASHEDRNLLLSPAAPPGFLMAELMYYMAIDGGYLNGTSPMGVFSPSILKIPGLYLGEYDNSGAAVLVSVPYGPLYDAVREIAETYQVGMKIILVYATDEDYRLEYRNYKGRDRTSAQTFFPPVRFSPDMESLTNIKELQSISGFKTLVYSYAPSNPGGLAATPGFDARVSLGSSYTGFDLRAKMIFAEDLTTDTIGGDAQKLVDILNSRARDSLAQSKQVAMVDGEIVSTGQFKYGVHYQLGDIIELQGNSGTLQNARVTEYIRVQDGEGERAFPSVEIME